jgi:hypothetical protein
MMTFNRLWRHAVRILALAAATTACGGESQPPREPQMQSSPQPVNEILRIEDDTKFAIAMSDLVFAREQATGYAQLTPAERVVFCLDGLEREVNNGGFAQFFENSAGDHAMDTIEALKTLGAAQMAALVADAVSVFPEGRPATDRERRQEQLARLDPQAKAKLDQLDDAFYKYPENLAALERQYVRAHQDQFRMP